VLVLVSGCRCRVVGVGETAVVATNDMARQNDNEDDAGQGLMHADGYTMIRITDEGCANNNQVPAIIRIILIIVVVFTMMDDRDDAGKGLMHADGSTMTEIVVLTKVVLMTIIPKGLLYYCRIVFTSNATDGFVSYFLVIGQRWRRR